MNKSFTDFPVGRIRDTDADDFAAFNITGLIGDNDADDVAVFNITETIQKSPECRKIFLTAYENYCKKWMVSNISDDGEKDGRNKYATPCPCIPPKLGLLK